MTTSAIRLAVFDCDGTLSDGQAAVCDAMEAAFAGLRLEPPERHEIRHIVGLSLPQAMVQLAPNERRHVHAQLVEGYKTAFRDARLDGRLHEPMFDGMVDLLHRLHDQGWLLAMATGKSDRGLNATLAANDLTHLFTTLHTADHHASKPYPAMIDAAMAETGALPEHTVMIGDTVYDMQMACTAQARAVGVGWGYHAASDLRDAGAVAVAADAAELEAIING